MDRPLSKFELAQHIALMYRNGLRLFRIGRCGQVVQIVDIDKVARTAVVVTTRIGSKHPRRKARVLTIALSRLTTFNPSQE